jgi:mono/diheme cytochrome c family protein
MAFINPFPILNLRRKTVVRTASILLLSPLACQQQKALYQLPTAMREEVKSEYRQLCDKGYLLYTTHCGGCHSIGKGKKKIIPDFSPEQIKGYEIRVMNKQHESSMPDSLLSADELVMISTFLMYKIPSGQPMKKK